MFEIGVSYWIVVKSVQNDKTYSIKVKPIEESAGLLKAEVSHGDKPSTVDIIPFSRILDVSKA